MKIFLTCEHASKYVPKNYQHLIAKNLIDTHRGYDIGAKKLAEYMRSYFSAPLVEGNISRLVIDLNRSLANPNLCPLIKEEKDYLVSNYYRPYRDLCLEKLTFLSDKNFVFHISVHSFTRILGKQKRNNVFGLLFDPKRASEKEIANEWKLQLEMACDLKVRKNYPYLGSSDGHTKALRKIFPQKKYAGIELEVCNDHLDTTSKIKKIGAIVCSSLQKVLEGYGN